METSVYAHFFYGFWVAVVFPAIVGVFIGIKRALWASALETD